MCDRNRVNTADTRHQNPYVACSRYALSVMQFLAVETIYCLIFCENEAVKVRKQRVAMV